MNETQSTDSQPSTKTLEAEPPGVKITRAQARKLAARLRRKNLGVRREVTAQERTAKNAKRKTQRASRKRNRN